MNNKDERTWWDDIGTMRWQQVVLWVVTIGAFVAICFSPGAVCSLDISSTPPTTTTTTIIQGK